MLSKEREMLSDAGEDFGFDETCVSDFLRQEDFCVVEAGDGAGYWMGLATL